MSGRPEGAMSRKNGLDCCFLNLLVINEWNIGRRCEGIVEIVRGIIRQMRQKFGVVLSALKPWPIVQPWGR